MSLIPDSFKKKLSALPSPEREITTVNLKKDAKYGLGKDVPTVYSVLYCPP